MLHLLLAFLLCSSIVVACQTPVAAQEAGADDAAADEEPVEKQKSYLAWMIESSGPIGAVLFLMSFITVASSSAPY